MSDHLHNEFDNNFNKMIIHTKMEHATNPINIVHTINPKTIEHNNPIF